MEKKELNNCLKNTHSYSPLLSIVTVTFNHCNTIVKTIESVIQQNVNFAIEYIIADDCSTDGTREIVEGYVQKYPSLIKLVTSEHNVGAVANEQRAFLAAKGRYIATCEGDDYWTDPFKLQRQVDFLESHPDYSVCFHRFRTLHVEDGREDNDGCDNLFTDTEKTSIEISMHQFMHQWCTQYLTMVFRKDCYDFDAYGKYKYFRDTHQVYHLMKNGRCRLFSFYGGVYRMTGGGTYTTMDEFCRAQMTLNVDRELWKNNKDKRWKEMCTIVMQNIIDNFASLKEYKTFLVEYAFSIFFQSLNIRKFVKNILAILK